MKGNRRIRPAGARIMVDTVRDLPAVSLAVTDTMIVETNGG